MVSVNDCLLKGWVSHDSALQQSNDRIPYVVFILRTLDACDDPIWHEVRAYGECAQSLHAGDFVAVHGAYTSADCVDEDEAMASKHYLLAKKLTVIQDQNQMNFMGDMSQAW